jgi:hypothetical protein
MGPGRRLGAARHAAVVLIATQLLPTLAWADGELQLLLPIVSAMAFGVSAVETAQTAHAGGLATPAPPRQGGGLLPKRLRIPDGYAVDYDRAPPHFAAPVDSDRVVGFDVLQRPRRGWTASFAYDEENRGPFPGTAEVVRFVAEFRF